MMTTVLALDQATRTGWTFGGTKIDLRRWESGRFRLPKRDEEGERLIICHDSILELIDTFEPDLLAYEKTFDPTWDAVEAAKKGEEPRGGMSRATFVFLEHVVAAVTMAAARRSIPTECYTPQQWQATLQLPRPPLFNVEGDALYSARRKWRKKAIASKVKSMGARVETEDEADSFGICLHACHGKPAVSRAQDDLFARKVAQL